MSSSDPTNIWAWIHEDEKRLKQEGSAKRAIVEEWDNFQYYHHNDDAAADHAINRALELARSEGELRWELLLRHWRLQLWLNHDLTKVLPEAIDLLSLVTDERVRDVPQRICAFHDLVDCHVRMDAVGYYDDIVANALDVLAQLPERHPCASCARLNLKSAASEAGRAEEAEAWIARFRANLHRRKETWADSTLGVAEAYEALGRWEEAKREYEDAARDARKAEEGDTYLEALLGLARVQVRRGEVEEGASILRRARHFAKYATGTYLLARLLETEGYVAEAMDGFPVALDYFTRAARQYLELGRYRAAALTSLHAAEMARQATLESADEALAVAARAVGVMPPASKDVRERLERLGRQPLPPAAPATGTGAADGLAAAVGNEEQGQSLLDKQEQAALEETLAAHMQNGNARGVAMALYRLGRWYASREQPRAALDYLISNAVLERLLQLPMDDREDALNILKHMQEKLPPGAVAAALAAAESGPSALLAPMLGELPASRWRWLVRGVAAELEEKPVIEPEPEEARDDNGFSAWLDHVASMVALIVRFRERTDPAKCERWAGDLIGTAEQIEAHLGPNGEGREPATLARGLAALARGANPEEVAQQVLPPFNQVIEQISAVAQAPVWHHPGASPLDFMVEQAAQRAVRALRIHDEHRGIRLENLAWRFELMTLDLREHEDLEPILRFLEALQQFMLANGESLPAVNPPLEEPFAAVLAAVYEAGRQPADQEEDAR